MTAVDVDLFAADLFSGTYTCVICESRYTSEDMFYRNKKTPTGRCRGCHREIRRSWYEANTESAKRYSTTWKRENRAAWRDSLRKSKYGIPPGTYASMLAEQSGCCAICSRPEPTTKAFDVDHDHVTGRVRALLCQRSNTGIGHFADDAALLLIAAEYLIKWGEPK